MTMGPGDEMRLKLRIDTTQLADDLAAVDKHIDKIQRLMQQTFNRTRAVQKGRASRALNFTDVLEGQEYWTPEVHRLNRMLQTRVRHIERAAQAGELEPPPTIKGRQRLEAQQRLDALRKQSGPLEITAKQRFFDDMVQSLRRGAPNMVGMAAGQTGIPGASGLARMLMGLAGANPLVAGGLGAAVAVGAGGIALEAERARFQRQQASLASALVGGPAFGEQRTMLGLGVMAAAQQMSASKEEGGAIAYQLASAGMRPGQVTKNMQTVLGMTGGYGLQAGDVEPLVAALGTAGGMSAAQIKTTLGDIVDASGKATGSIQQLTQGLGALSAVNARAGRDAFGLAAVQHAVGPTSGINAGQLMAPAMGAFGGQALGLAGLLGISPERLVQMQQSKGGQAQLYDLASAFMRQMPHDVTGQELGLQILSDVGAIDTSHLRADQKLQQARTMQTARPGQAYADFQRRARAPRPRHPSPAELARHNKSAWDQFWLNVGNMVTQAANDPQHEGGPALAARSRALGMTGPVPTAPAALAAGGGGGKFGLRTLSPALVGQVRAAATDVNHTVKIDVTVKDQRGNQLGHAVDHKRVIAGSSGTLRPPYDHPGRSNPPPWTGGGSSGGHGGGGGSSGFD